MVDDDVCDFFQAVRSVTSGAGSIGNDVIGEVFEHADGGARPTRPGPSGLSSGV